MATARGYCTPVCLPAIDRPGMALVTEGQNLSGVAYLAALAKYSLGSSPR